MKEVNLSIIGEEAQICRPEEIKFILTLCFISPIIKKYTILIYTNIRKFLYVKMYYFIGGQLKLNSKDIVIFLVKQNSYSKKGGKV